MTEPIIDKKVPDGVSKAVYKKVRDIADGDGSNNRKIDSKKEYEELSQYLAGNSNDMNRAEKAFVQEQLKEYEDLAAEESKNEFMDKVTEAAKELVKRFAKGSGADDKKIDSVQEAEGLLKELDNPQNDFNAADVKYIQQVVEESGVIAKKPSFGIVGEKNDNVNATNAEPKSPAAAPAKPEEAAAAPSKEQEPAVVTKPEVNENKPAEKKDSVEEKSADSDKKAPEAAPAKPGKPAAKPSKSKPKSKAKPAAKTETPPKAEEPKYDENQKKLISDMNYRITRILEDRSQEYYRNIDINIGKKLLRDAKALGLENTKEYKQLEALCNADNAEKKAEGTQKPKSRWSR